MQTDVGVDRRGGRALRTGPYPPGWSRRRDYGALATGSLSFHLLALLAGPRPSGSTGLSRRCRGCSHLADVRPSREVTYCSLIFRCGVLVVDDSRRDKRVTAEIEPSATAARSATTGMTTSTTGFGLCGGCARLDRCQLGIHEERATSTTSASYTLTCPPEREGSRGVAHGGWIADVFDEALGRVITLGGRFAVTSALDVRFHRPVPIAVPLVIEARERESGAGRIVLEGRLRLAHGEETLASAEARFAPRDLDAHLARFQSWATDQTK